MNGRFEQGFETTDAKQALGGISASARASLMLAVVELQEAQTKASATAQIRFFT